ncbi:MAG: glycerol-3-phosphate dehydrogenase, partial [Chloroflexi bacterium]|nr:glycerol-3-phosphate dehydrogenase [Chloroflexota bacterium]
MARVTVLGAGFMGSALATVAAHRGHEVRLWGTWLDDAIVDAIHHAGEHPRLRIRLPGRIA